MNLPRWASGPFELILHAETHYKLGADIDRRIALIGFDNSIEVSITNYLSLKPIHRNNKDYDGAKVLLWKRNYHTKVDFFLEECTRRSISHIIDKEHIVWYHEIRNEQYHAGGSAIPAIDDLNEIRKTALWVFSVLYGVDHIETLLEEKYSEIVNKNKSLSSKKEEYDLIIDEEYDPVEIAGILIRVSDVLYSHDPVAYLEIALEIADEKLNATTDKDSL